MSLSFKPWHGQPYKRFIVLAEKKGQTKKIGRLLAPNSDLALVKARQCLPDYPSLTVEERPPKKKPTH